MKTFNWARWPGMAGALLMAAALGVGCEEQGQVEAVSPEEQGVVEPIDAEAQADAAAQRQEAGAQQPRATGQAGVLTLGGGVLEVAREGSQDIRPGESYEYTLIVTNQSDSAVEQVRLQENLPTGFEVEDVQGVEQYNLDQGQLNIQLGTLQADVTRRVVITGLLPANGHPEQVHACLTASYQPAMCQTLAVVNPELQLQRAILNTEGERTDMIYACEQAVFIYQITNTGTGETDPVVVSEQLPEFLATEDGESMIEFEIESLAAGETIERRAVVVPSDPGAYAGRATAKTDQLAVRSSAGGLAVVEPELNLVVDGPQRTYLDRAVTYQLRLTNTSEYPTEGTYVQVQAPEGVDRLEPATQNIAFEDNRFAVGQLDPGQTATMAVTFSAVEPGSLESAFLARAECAVADQATIATEIVGIPALRLEAFDLTDPVPVGEYTTYEISVQNQGTREDMNVQIQGQLPEGMEFIEAEGDTQVQGEQGQLTFGPIDQLDPGEVVSWRVRGRATAAGKQRLRLEMTSDASQRPIIEMEPTTLY